MNNVNILFWLRDILACLGILVGLAASIFLFVRKKTSLGILALVGFLLFSTEPIMDIVFWRILINSMNMDWHLDIVYACCTGISMLIGPVLIAVALFLGFRPEPVKEEEVPLPEA